MNQVTGSLYRKRGCSLILLRLNENYGAVRFSYKRIITLSVAAELAVSVYGLSFIGA